MGKLEEICEKKCVDHAMNLPPVPPPLPGPVINSHRARRSESRGQSSVSTATKDMWEKLFDEGYRADVVINTDNGGSIFAHSNILGMASPVMRGMLKQAKKHRGRRSIFIRGVPHDAVRVFIRFLYSSCYEKEEVEEFVLPLLVLSHVFVVVELKKLCVQRLVQGFLTTENVVDIFQLALLCDAPRLSFICHRMILRDFENISVTEGWKAMKESHPMLKKQLLESILDEDNRQKEWTRRVKEGKIYLQLYEAMEALVHICRDGCKTIGPYDRDFSGNETPCTYAACKGIEQLVRHFAGCKLRIPGGCIHCKRMWQLLELHSRLCLDSNVCRVPLCRNFKNKLRKQSKKDEIKWRILVKKMVRTKRIGGSPFFVSDICC
ncbi:BTB/POZ and TAZ domain-containing protein 4 [Euphorbia lathyris]|uniref:BTB/POZ and TAZ domain-containing protein 4 n=1 Tax=Euphorbia lathyris TaxID=212925 RepID=UPI003313FBA3